MYMVMLSLELMQRLAALVPRPRLNLIRFHSVLAPNAKWRAQVVPGKSLAAQDTNDKAIEDFTLLSLARLSLTWACHRDRRSPS